MLKQISIDLSSTNGTTLPGYKRGLDYLGINDKYKTPGLPFIAGFQDPKVRYKLAEGGHLSSLLFGVVSSSSYFFFLAEPGTLGILAFLRRGNLL